MCTKIAIVPTPTLCTPWIHAHVRWRSNSAGDSSKSPISKSLFGRSGHGGQAGYQATDAHWTLRTGGIKTTSNVYVFSHDSVNNLNHSTARITNLMLSMRTPHIHSRPMQQHLATRRRRLRRRTPRGMQGPPHAQVERGAAWRKTRATVQRAAAQAQQRHGRARPAACCVGTHTPPLSTTTTSVSSAPPLSPLSTTIHTTARFDAGAPAGPRHEGGAGGGRRRE